MKGSLLVASLMIAALLAGCASKELAYPAFKDKKSVFVSGETISTMTETPAGDYLIPNSQVFLSGSSDISNKKLGVAALFGAAGGVVLVNAERNASKSAFGDSRNKVPSRFDALVAELLGEKISMREDWEIVSEGSEPEIKFLPSARFQMGSNGSSSLAFQLHVRFQDKVTGKRGKKAYTHITSESRKMEGEDGWMGEDGKRISNAARIAFGRIVQVVLIDIDGKLLSGERLPQFDGFSILLPAPNTIVLVGQ